MKSQDAVCSYRFIRVDLLERVPNFWKQVALELLPSDNMLRYP